MKLPSFSPAQRWRRGASTAPTGNLPILRERWPPGKGRMRDSGAGPRSGLGHKPDTTAGRPPSRLRWSPAPPRELAEVARMAGTTQRFCQPAPVAADTKGRDETPLHFPIFPILCFLPQRALPLAFLEKTFKSVRGGRRYMSREGCFKRLPLAPANAFAAGAVSKVGSRSFQGRSHRQHDAVASTCVLRPGRRGRDRPTGQRNVRGERAASRGAPPFGGCCPIGADLALRFPRRGNHAFHGSLRGAAGVPALPSPLGLVHAPTFSTKYENVALKRLAFTSHQVRRSVSRCRTSPIMACDRLPGTAR